VSQRTRVERLVLGGLPQEVLLRVGISVSSPCTATGLVDALVPMIVQENPEFRETQGGALGYPLTSCESVQLDAEEMRVCVVALLAVVC